MSSHDFCGLGVWPWLSGDFAVKGLPGLSASLRLNWGKICSRFAWWSAAFCFSAVGLGPWFFAGVGWRALSAPRHVVLTGCSQHGSWLLRVSQGGCLHIRQTQKLCVV